MFGGGADVVIIAIKCTISAICSNHPQTMPPSLVRGKIVFHEARPWCQEARGQLPWRQGLGSLRTKAEKMLSSCGYSALLRIPRCSLCSLFWHRTIESPLVARWLHEGLKLRVGVVWGKLNKCTLCRNYHSWQFFICFTSPGVGSFT